MPNIVSSTVFCFRNTEKAEKKDNDASRLSLVPVIMGQVHNSLVAANETISAFDKAAGATHPSHLTRISNSLKEDKLFANGFKAAEWAGKNVNPLVVCASAVDVLTSDDKEDALIRNSAGLGVMFAAEHCAKTCFSDKVLENSNFFKKIPNKVSDFATKQGFNKIADFITKEHVSAIFPKAVAGAALVGFSITGYALGSKFGTLVANSMGHQTQDNNC